MCRTVLGSTSTVGSDALLCARYPTLLIVQRSSEAISKDVEPCAVSVRGNVVGHFGALWN